MSEIVPVILAGGIGTRLWPLSRKNYPKQFTDLLGEESLFQRTAKRYCSSDQVNFSSPITITNTEFRFIITEQLNQIGIDPGAILIEPCAKNTGPAIQKSMTRALFIESLIGNIKEKYFFEKKLGSGGYGAVYLAKNKTTGKFVI